MNYEQLIKEIFDLEEKFNRSNSLELKIELRKKIDKLKEQARKEIRYSDVKMR